MQAHYDVPDQCEVDSCYLRRIIPEEMWLELFKWVKLIDEKDLENWSNSSPYFRHLLEDQRVTFLFPQVIDILAPKYEQPYPPEKLKDNCFREDQVDLNPDADFPNDWDWDNTHELTGIMKCRLICRSWNKVIQKYYEDPKKPSGGTHLEMKYAPSLIHGGEIFDKLELFRTLPLDVHLEPDFPDVFMEHFNGCFTNPFIGRSLKCRDLIGPHVPPQFEEGVHRILEKFGTEIWYFETDIDVSTPEEIPDLYLRFHRWIKMMPNLRSLKITQQEYRDDEWNCLEPLTEYLPPLEGEIRGNPLPKLEHLEFLSVKDLLAPIFNELVHQNGHISGLEMERDEAHEKVYEYDLDYVLSSMPNLKRLGIHSFTEEELVKLEEKRDELQVEKFQLTDKNGSPFHWERLLGPLKRSSGTLTELVLELPFVGNKEDEGLLELTKILDLGVHLEKVERLVLFVGRPLFLDWLLPMKDALKEVELVIPPYLGRVKGYDKVVREQTIELLGFEEKMDKSNIWKVFKSLEVVKIGKGYLSECEEWKEFTRLES